jgi:CspA family cold shock protein
MGQSVGRPIGHYVTGGFSNVDTEQKARRDVTGQIRTIRADKGFGFIKDETGKEYFFHRSAVYGEGLEDLREGDGVEFDLGEGPKGPRAGDCPEFRV